jgi:threonine dehydratase
MPEDMIPAPPGAAEIADALARIAPHIVATPLLFSPAVDARLGFRLLVKAESLQRTGSFKFRGALNALLSLDKDARQRGVVAYSSGNHAQGVAAAAQLLGMPAIIVMPADAPAIKAANTKAYGAELVFYDRYTESREAIAGRIAAERGAALIPPYDDARVIAGQGTAGLELARQALAMGVRLDAVLAPCSGGGLVAGVALAVKAASPNTSIYAAEPQTMDDMRRSLAAGDIRANDPAARSICDSLLAPSPGKIPFAIARRLLAGILTASDDETCRAMVMAFADYKLVLEPGGAVALAAVLATGDKWHGKTVAVIASGGNVDAETFKGALTRAAR